MKRWTRYIKRFAVTIGVVLLGFTVLVVVDELEKQQQASTTNVLKKGPLKVSVVELNPVEHNVEIETLARIEPLYDSELSSLVDGRVASVEPAFTEGNLVDAGTVLIRIEDSELRAEVANAKYTLSQAKIDLLKEEREVQQARREWAKTSKNKKPYSPLVFREPQLNAAKLNVTAAQQNLKRAQRLLSYATVRAPYKGTVVTRDIDPGETVSVGQLLGRVMSVGQYQITAQLTERQWALLEAEPEQSLAYVELPGAEQKLPAKIRSTGLFVESDTQLRNVYIDVDVEQSLAGDSVVAQADSDASRLLPNTLTTNQYAVMLPGRLVKVTLPGRTLHKVWRLPESAFTRDSHIWLIDDQGRLAKEPVELLTADHNVLVIDRHSPFDQQEPIRVVRFPQARFTVGQPVEELMPNTAEETLAVQGSTTP